MSKSTESKLWVKVPAQGYKNAANQQTPIRPTITTLLRRNQLLEKNDKEEKKKVQGFLQGSVNYDDYDSWRTRKELEKRKEQEAAETKRLLQAKLAYHKAIAAQRESTNLKVEKAAEVRTEGKKLKERALKEEELEIERKRRMTQEVHERTSDWKEAVQQTQIDKQRQAKELKNEVSKFKEEIKWKREEELLERKERIQKIQASKLALRVSTGQHLTPGAFKGALGSPDQEIKLKLAKEAEKEELEDKRRKVRQLKKKQENKMEVIKQKIHTQSLQDAARKNLYGKFKDVLSMTTVDLPPDEDPEVTALARQLQQLKSINSAGMFPNSSTRSIKGLKR